MHLEGSTSILDLSLVNRRFRDIALDAILRKLYIPKVGIRRLLEMLVANPDSIRKVRCLDLCKYGCMHQGDCRYLGSLKFNAPTARFLCNSIDQTTMHNVTWDHIQQAKGDPTHWFNKAHSLFLNILVALCSMLKELTMWLPPRQNFARARPQVARHFYASVTPFEGPTLEILQQNLEVLTFKCGFQCKGNAIRLIRLPGFRNLKSLTIPMDNLGPPSMIDFYRSDVVFVKSRQGDDRDRAAGRRACLPLTLTGLHLTSCNRHTFVLLDVLNCLPTGTLFLKCITLSFDVSACSALVLCSFSRWLEPIKDKARKWKRMIENLVSNSHYIELFADQSSAVYKYGRKSSFLDEMNAITLLSHQEVAEIAGANMQLSDYVARSNTGPRARNTLLEHRLFLIHGIEHHGLFCSPTFDATYWADVAFFHNSPDCPCEEQTRVSIERPENTKARIRRATRHLPVVADLTKSAFSLRVPPHLGSTTQPSPLPARSPSSFGAKRVAKHTTNVSKREYTCRAEESTLIFNSDIWLWTGIYNLRSGFQERFFQNEAWSWYLQPRVGAVESGSRAGTAPPASDPYGVRMQGKRQHQ